MLRGYASRNCALGQSGVGSRGPAVSVEGSTFVRHSTLITPVEGTSRSGLITALESFSTGRMPATLSEGGRDVAARKVVVSSQDHVQGTGQGRGLRKTSCCPSVFLVSTSRCCFVARRVMVLLPVKDGGSSTRGGREDVGQVVIVYIAVISTMVSRRRRASTVDATLAVALLVSVKSGAILQVLLVGGMAFSNVAEGVRLGTSAASDSPMTSRGRRGQGLTAALRSTRPS